MTKIFPGILILFFTGFFIRPLQAQEDTLTTATISAVGDLMCHSVQYNYARIEKDSFDFNPVYRGIRKYFYETDFLFGNLETVTAGSSKGYSGYPLFNTPDDFIPALKKAGFDLITTSNNHSLDRGEAGLLRTIKLLKENGLSYNGTFNSREDRDSIRIFDINGIKTAFLAYTFGTNGIPVPAGKSYLINLIDYDLIRNDIHMARIRKAEIVLVHYHFGQEYEREPNAFQKEVVLKTIESGADIIIGGHPHVLQPVDYFKTSDAKLETGFIAYSLGNFISNQRWRYSDAGAIINIKLTKNLRTGSIFISSVEFIPTWVFKGETDERSEFIVLPAFPDYESDITAHLSADDKELLYQSFADTKSILTRYTGEIKLYEDMKVITDVKPRETINTLTPNKPVKILNP